MRDATSTSAGSNARAIAQFQFWLPAGALTLVARNHNDASGHKLAQAETPSLYGLAHNLRTAPSAI
jgi:hypothetical protein